MKKIDESKALQEVWSWKESAYAEVKKLPIAAAIHERLRRAVEAAARLETGKTVTSRCAENREKYGDKET